jgi:hypothetical protein
MTKCLKYLALHQRSFKYILRAYMTCIIGIVSVLVIQYLSIRYLIAFETVLDTLNNFIKMKILASFDEFFVEPFKT